jgi:hypothetical protein
MAFRVYVAMLVVIISITGCCTPGGSCCNNTGCDPTQPNSPCCGWMNAAAPNLLLPDLTSPPQTREAPPAGVHVSPLMY